MKRFLKITALVMISLLILGGIGWYFFLRPGPLPVSNEDRQKVSIMPLPAEMSMGEGHYLINAGLGHKLTRFQSDRLNKAVGRFRENLQRQTGVPLVIQGNPRLFIDCRGESAGYPLPGDRENYSLKIKQDGIYIISENEFGVMHALETLLQLASHTEAGWGFPQLVIRDSPRYPWRGLMVDVSRHWIPGSVMRRIIDGMATVKLNVLHWHLSDYQGFRVESVKFPRLHKTGSGGQYYEQQEIRDIIDYAADRGIRIVPEFDLPGHSTPFLRAYPELASAPGAYQLDTLMGIHPPVIDPTRESTYDFLDTFIGEMATLFPDPYLHIGGDEVNPSHWYENVDIQAFMEARDMADHHDLQAYFNLRLQAILKKHGKTMMGWDEIIHPELEGNDILVQSWRSQQSLWEAARRGFDAVLSAGYYLDHQRPASFHYKVDPEVIRGAVNIEVDTTNWRSWDCTVYFNDTELNTELYLFGEAGNLRGISVFNENAIGFTDVTANGNSLSFSAPSDYGTIDHTLTLQDDSLTGSMRVAVFDLELRGKRSGGSGMPDGKPLPRFEKIDPLTEDEAERILGGEACMWSEMVDSVTIESRIWPRAGAIAEKLWTPASLTTDTEDMYRRLMVLDHYLGNRGMQHRESMDKFVYEITDHPQVNALRNLVLVLEEDIMFSRLSIYEPQFTTNEPLNRVVDAARPESYVAYRFGQDVNKWLEGRDTLARERIRTSLQTWAGNHQRLEGHFEGNKRLMEVYPHSRHLSRIAELGLAALSAPGNTDILRDSRTDSLFMEAEKTYGGTTLAVTDPIRRLVGAAQD